MMDRAAKAAPYLAHSGYFLRNFAKRVDFWASGATNFQSNEKIKERFMSTTTTDKPEEAMEMGTKPLKEHEWLQKLVGEWKTEAEMSMGPDQPKVKSTGTESVKSYGGLFAFGEGKGTMPNGDEMGYKFALGYDVSFKEYRAVKFMSVSSHLWNSKGTLSADGKVMTLDCVGPNMYKDGETANYRDVIEIVDDNHLTYTSFGEDESGKMEQYMKAQYTRA
jgi:hypothetical protein